MTGHELDRLVDGAEARLPGLIDQVFARTIETIPIYRDGAQVSIEELRHSIDDNLRFLIGAIRRPAASLDLSVPKGTGRRRAHQGVPLPEVLQVYRIGFATLWDALVGTADGSARPSETRALLATSTLIWKVADEHATALTEAYRAATAELLVAQEHRRAALVEVLLTGHVGRDAGPWEAAALLGFPPDAELVVVAAQARELAEESLPGAEQVLAERGFVSGWRLTPSLQLGVVSVSAQNVPDLLAALRELARARVGVSPVYQSPTDTPRALRLARAALGGIGTATVDVRMFSSSPVAALMANDPAEGGRLAEEVLGPVLRLPAADRALLLRTLDAYLDNGGSAADAAAELHCHPNTVRYRLRRLEELTGRSLAHPNSAAELAAAAYAVRLGSDQRGS